MTQQITAASFASKYKSKREIFNFLTVDVNAYLPPYENLTIYFFKDLVCDKKPSEYDILTILLYTSYTVLKANQIRHLAMKVFLFPLSLRYRVN